MKLFACLLILLFAMPVCVVMVVQGVGGDDVEFAEVDLASVARPGGSPEYRVAIEGYLLRVVPPAAARMKDKYVLPFVSEAEAAAALATGSFSYSASSTPVFVEAPGEELPVEIFMRAEGALPDPVAVPFTFEGTQQTEGSNAPPVVARIPGAGGGREIILLRSKSATEVSRGVGIAFGIAGCVLLLICRSLFRSWWQDRRARKEHAAAVAAMRGKPLISRAGFGKTPKPAASGGGLHVPWGKVAGVFVVIGVIGAKVGKHAGSSVDDLARGVMRSADEVGSIGRGADRITSGERALETLGTALDVESAAEVVGDVLSSSEEGEPAAAPVKGAPSASASTPGSVRLNLKVTNSREVYYAEAWSSVGTDAWSREGSMELDLTPLPGEPLRFFVAGVLTEAEASGSVAGSYLPPRTATFVELPDRSRGEFTHIELRPSGDGVRMTQVMGFAGELGYVDVFRATGQMEFLNGRTWTDLCSTGLTAMVGFTEAGRLEYAQTAAPSYARAAEISLGKEGLRGLSLKAEFTVPAVEVVEIHKGQLILSQRNVSEIRIRERS